MMPAKNFLGRQLGSWLAAGLLAAISTTAAAQDSSKKFIMHEAPKPIAAIRFEDGQGQSRSVSDFRGRVVLLNIWATWCVPCRKEMPALDRLQATLGGPTFEIVALSIDRGGIDAVRKFFAELGLRHLAMYVDGSGRASRELGAVGLPTTLLVDRQGREIGSLIGPAEWDAPEMVEFVKCVISLDDAAPSRTESKSAAPPCGESSSELPGSRKHRNGRP